MEPSRLVERRLGPLATGSGPVCLIAIGKASQAMADGAMRVLGDRIANGLVVPPVPLSAPAPLHTIVGEHPKPGAGSERAGDLALSLAESVDEDGTLIVMISGGASSLVAVPAVGITLEDKRGTTDVLLRAGADIQALNTVRKHLSRVKGGRLAAACRGTCCALVLSDVVGDDLSVIASGPTVADPSTFDDAMAVLDRFGGWEAFPVSVVSHLTSGAHGKHDESPKPGDPRLARARTELVGGRRDAMHGAAAAAERCGYEVVMIDEAIVGEARIAGGQLAERLLAMPVSDRPLCVVASGETTVRVTGRGKGGRNQELALAVAMRLAPAGRRYLFASVGTDGIDGPTDAAGAIVDQTTLERAARAGMAEPASFLEGNDTYAFFDAIGDLIRTGPTGTNVGDIQVCVLR